MQLLHAFVRYERRGRRIARAADPFLQRVRHSGVSERSQDGASELPIFVGMVELLKSVKPEDLTENSVLLGDSARIVEILKKVEAAGFAEVVFHLAMRFEADIKVENQRWTASCVKSLHISPAYNRWRHTDGIFDP